MLDLLADTGTTHTTATAPIELEGQELPTICLMGPPGGLALLGGVTLEEFALGVDPTGRRLVPVSGYLTATAR